LLSSIGNNSNEQRMILLLRIIVESFRRTYSILGSTGFLYLRIEISARYRNSNTKRWNSNNDNFNQMLSLVVKDI
jgi:hypothetical protein